MKTKELPPYHRNGSTYGFDSAGNRVCTGSRMGRCNVIPENADAWHKLHLRRVRFYDGAYDAGGAYWGSPCNLFCAWSGEVEIYVRANSRAEAKLRVRMEIPGAAFYR